ncbi:hypothetical protein PAECIP111893_01533 [Paenibacillus plantiphilus]|uniref:Uncharacterized protein n=1 Tax=Paenibacillus plantiphilus TaxID=2905650 RepID=A0ABN8GAK1_9BACL|nr:hypothetical protein PAECIP111893_01533 [Paenibacillus plantiphilus]
MTLLERQPERKFNLHQQEKLPRIRQQSLETIFQTRRKSMNYLERGATMENKDKFKGWRAKRLGKKQ